MECDINNDLIEKRILSAGKKYVPLRPGARVRFHFQTRKGTDGILLDDSRNWDQPMELVLGKKFKLHVWEVMVKMMSENEVAKFTVHKSLVVQYPYVSKTLRDVHRKVEHRHHCCGMSMQYKSIGYKDLDDLLANPCDLEFIIDLLSIEHPEDYKKENWQLSDDERLTTIAELKKEGNSLFAQKNYKQAEECYRQGVGMVEQLLLKEKPNDVEWLELAKIKVPLLLNYAQCRLIDNDYYAVIEHCTEVLKLQPTNVKALYRRGKAHFGAWNPKEARNDFKEAARLDPKLENAVSKELKAIDENQQKRDLEDKQRMKNLFSST